MLRIIIGFVIAVMVIRNAQVYHGATVPALVLSAVVGWIACYYFGRRDKNIAVATAVATAVAVAEAKADARAQAVATSAVQIYMQSGQMPTSHEMEIVAAYHDGEISDDHVHDAITEHNSEYTAIERASNS